MKFNNYNKKYFYLFLLVLFGGISLYFTTSFALFKKTDKLTNIDFVAGSLNYTITNSSLSNNSITVAAGSVRTLTLTLKSTNSIASKYELYYLIDDKKVANDSVIIGYTSGSGAVKGTINANASKSITIKIKNVSNKSVKITFGCEGGLSSNTLTLSKGLSLDRLITDGDIEMYYTYVGTGTAPTKFPSKSSGYYVKSLTCNGVNATWNNATWSLAFSNATSSNIICSAQIDTAYLNNFVMSLADVGASSQVRKDTHAVTGNQTFATTEYRYYGQNVDNYVSFNGEPWRIIGVFDVDNGSGTVQKRVKIVRNAPIGEYSWDSSGTSVNSGKGVNEWSQADLQKLLNSGLYYNRTSGGCYAQSEDYLKSCSFSTTGLTSAAKAMIGNAKWYLGAFEFMPSLGPSRAAFMYNQERGSLSGCSSCDDKVTRTTTWVGKVGLMYPSDFAYTVYDDKTWMNNYSGDWFLSPCSRGNSGYYSYCVAHVQYSSISDGPAYFPNYVRPTVYLLPTIKLTGGSGTANDMYTISQ